MKTKLSLPFVTPEIEFFARYTDLVNEILDSKDKDDVQRFTKAITDRTIVDIDARFEQIERDVDAVVRGLFRIEWVNTNRGKTWQCWGRVFNPLGRKKRVGSLGFVLGDGAHLLRLYGWFWPKRAGLDDLRSFCQTAGRWFPSIYIHREHQERLPSYYDDCGIIWFEEQLTIKTTIDDVSEVIGKNSKLFFRRNAAQIKKLAKK